MKYANQILSRTAAVWVFLFCQDVAGGDTGTHRQEKQAGVRETGKVESVSNLVNVVLTFTTTHGFSYQVMRSVDLIHWQEVGSLITGNAGKKTVTDKGVSSTRYFYRLKVVEP